MKIISVRNLVAVLMLLLMSCSAMAQMRTEREALQIAMSMQKPVMKQSVKAQGMVHAMTTPSIAHTIKEDGKPMLYAVNKGHNQGFVIVSADTKSSPVLGYTDRGDFDINNIPDGLKWFLKACSQQIAKSEGSTQPRRNAGAAQMATIAPLITSQWAQGEPYNNYCPIVNGQHTLVGCVAIVAGQIMNYYKQPAKGMGTHSYTWNGHTLTADYSETIDWNNILDSYYGASAVQEEPVAKLLYNLGVGVEMEYGLGESGAIFNYIPNVLHDYYGYNANAACAYRNYYSTSEWQQLIYEELAAGRPVPYSGQGGQGGHAFILDGFEDGNFHVNWGWSGQSDGYYDISFLIPNPSYPEDYVNDQYAIFGEYPTEMPATAASLSEYEPWTLSSPTLDANGRVMLTMSVVNTSAVDFNGKIGVRIMDMQTNETSYSYTENIELQRGYIIGLAHEVAISGAKAGHDYMLTPIFQSSGSSDWQELHTLPSQTKLVVKATGEATDVTEWFVRKMVAEEGTGTWCGWCPRGYVGMEYMRETYPDRFIGIAYHNDDEMSAIDNGGVSFFSFPSAVVNRNVECDPSKDNLIEMLQNVSGSTADAMVRVDEVIASENKRTITIKTTTRFGRNITDADYRLVYVVTEDGVGPYRQTNYYSGSSDDMGGFESQGSYVMLTFNDVARGVYPNINGEQGSVPSSIHASTDYTYSYDIKLPSNITNSNNVNLAVLLYNAATGEIVNADRMACPYISMVVQEDKELSYHVEVPGTLRELVGDEAINCAILHLSGKINGEDLRFLREIAGLGFELYSSSSIKVLRVLDMENVDIVRGGEYMHWPGANYESIIEEDNLLPDFCFIYNKSLKEVILPQSLKKIGNGAFAQTLLERIKLNEGLKEIGEGAFDQDTSLQSVDFPESVEIIHHAAFIQCHGLTQLRFPKHATFPTGNPAPVTFALETFEIDPENPNYVVKDGVLYTSDFKTLVGVPGGYKGAYTLGDDSPTPGTVLEIDNRCETIMSEGLREVAGVDVLHAESVKHINSDGLIWYSGKQIFFGPKLSQVDYAGLIGLGIYNGDEAGVSIYLPVATPIISEHISLFYPDGQNTLYVPKASIESYKNAEGWNQFGHILAYEESGFEMPTFNYIDNISLDKTQLQLEIGSTSQLIATILPENADDKTLEWESSNPEIATVDQNGKVVAVEEGEATITATATDGSRVFATCDVKVVVPEGKQCIAVNAYPYNSARIILNGEERSKMYVESGSNVEIKIEPAPLFTFLSVSLVDTEEWTGYDIISDIANNTYTIQNIQKNYNLDASLAIQQDGVWYNPEVEYEAEGNDTIYTYNTPTITHGLGYSGDVVIPEKVVFNHPKVKNGDVTIQYLSGWTFYDYQCENLHSISLPKTIEWLADADLMNSHYQYLIVNWEEPYDVGLNVFYNPWDENDSPDELFKRVTLMVPEGTLSKYKSHAVWGRFKNIVEGDDWRAYEKTFPLGDTNFDEKVSVTDYVSVASQIVEVEKPHKFNITQADVNADGVIDVADYVHVANIILFDSPNGPSYLSRNLDSDNQWSDAMMVVGKDRQNSIIVSVINVGEFSAFQFDMALPDGLAVEDVSKAFTSVGHQITWAHQGNNKYRFLCGSMDNSIISDKKLLNINLSIAENFDDGELKMDNIRLVQNNGTIHVLGDVQLMFSQAVSIIENVNINYDNDGVYDLQGRKVANNRKDAEKLPAGVYISNHQSFIVK